MSLSDRPLIESTSYCIYTIDGSMTIPPIRDSIAVHPLFIEYLDNDRSIVNTIVHTLLSTLIAYLPYVDIDGILLRVSGDIGNMVEKDKSMVSGIVYQILSDIRPSILDLIDEMMSIVHHDDVVSYRLFRYHPEIIMVLGSIYH